MRFKGSIFVIIMIIVTVLSACNNEKIDVSNHKGNENEENSTINVSKTDLPIVEDKITLEVFAGMGVQYTNDLKDVRGYEELEEITNVEIDWKQISNDSIDEKRNLALSGGNLPDVFYASTIPKLDILKYGQEGTLIKLNNLIDEYAPNLTKLMEENPEIRQAITLPDGNIYTLPYLFSPDSQSVRTFPILYFNQNVLDELDINKPETTDEFYKYLTAVKEKGLSDQNDSEVVPYGSPQIGDLVGWLEGSFGVGNRGRPFIDKDPNSDEVRFYPIDNDYKKLLEYMHKLYDEGLIAQNIFSIEKDQFVANAAEGAYGSTVFYDPGTVIHEKVEDVYVGGQPLRGPNGDQSKVLGHTVSDIGAFAITTENENPEATMRWVDHFYSDEGAKLLFLGVEGESYHETEDGEIKLAEEIANPPEGRTQDQELAEHAGYLPTGNTPGIIKEEYFKGAETTPDSLEAIEEMKEYLEDNAWPEFTYTEDESKVLSASGNDIEKYANEMRDKFISGDTSFDEWDDYVQRIKDMGLDDYMNIQQEAYERYKDN